MQANTFCGKSSLIVWYSYTWMPEVRNPKNN